MCGICGIFNYGNGAPAGKPLIEQMCGIMRHRGPDDQGVYTDGAIGLGMRRLSIIDLGGGHQPMSNEDGSLHIVFNGEIYNYVELRTPLESRGHRLATNSDTEVILHLYEDYGVDCLKHLRGMFAFCIWNSRNGEIFAARDRLGKKPFYYCDTGKRLVFASELKAVLCDSEVSRELDLNALDLFLSFRYTPAPRTILKSVKKLPAGCYLTCSADNGVKVEKYWDLKFGSSARISERDAAEALDATIRDAVRLRLRSDVPLGVFLSGGIDSSLMAALAADLTSNRIKTFSVGFRENEFNEFKHSQFMADTLDSEHHELTIEPLQFADFFEKFVWYQDEPLADPASIPLYFIARWAREEVTVVLSGEGADEIFAGYPRYESALRQLKIGETYNGLFPRAIRRGIIEPALLGLPLTALDMGRLRTLSENPSDICLLYNLVFGDHIKQTLYTREMAAQINKDNDKSLYRDLFNAPKDARHLDRLLYTDCKTWLPEDLLMKADKMTMAASVELRTPFLDHEVVALAASLPPDMKLKDGTSKYILKKIAKKHLPSEIVNRPKVGFPVPIGPWFRSGLYDFARDILCDASVADAGLFNPESVSKILDDHASARADHSFKIWCLLCFEQWRRLFLK